jgi:hypothetical protein
MRKDTVASPARATPCSASFNLFKKKLKKRKKKKKKIKNKMRGEPTVSRDSKSRNRRGWIHQLSDFFHQTQSSNDIINSL